MQLININKPLVLLTGDPDFAQHAQFVLQTIIVCRVLQQEEHAQLAPNVRQENSEVVAALARPTAHALTVPAIQIPLQGPRQSADARVMQDIT